MRGCIFIGVHGEGFAGGYTGIGAGIYPVAEDYSPASVGEAMTGGYVPVAEDEVINLRVSSQPLPGENHQRLTVSAQIWGWGGMSSAVMRAPGVCQGYSPARVDCCIQFLAKLVAEHAPYESEGAGEPTHSVAMSDKEFVPTDAAG